MPSELVIPVRRPAASAMWAMRRVVVLLPFVPVIATIGTRGRGRSGRGPGARVCERPDLATLGRLAEGHSCRRRRDRLAARPAAPREDERGPAPVGRGADHDARHRQVERDVEAAHRQAGRGGHVGGGAGQIGAEVELHGGPREEAVGAVEHAQLEQLDRGR